MENQHPQFGFNVLRILDSVFFVEEGLDPDPNEVKISYALGFHGNIEESWVQYNIRADFSTEATKTFATGTVVTKFGIDNMKSFIEGENIAWPVNSLETMFSIAFSHLRALLAKNMAGTKFSNYIVPLVNPATLFKQLMETHPDFQNTRAETHQQIGEKLKEVREIKSRKKKGA
jgi:hypothetical protein